MRSFKITLSILFVLAVSIIVARSCIQKEVRVPAGRPAVQKSKVLVKPAAKPKTVKPGPVAQKRSSPEPVVRPKMAIVLDDWGNNLALVKYALAVGRPLTLAVLPNLTYSRKIAEEAHAKGLGVMLHMPMEPMNTRERLEPHTIMTETPEDRILEYLEEALRAVPHAEGVNNHMGSAATSDRRVMKTVLGRIKKKGLFFIDSNVIHSTVGPATAEELGVRFAKRDVFIDNELNSQAIKAQLEKAAEIALSRGQVVVIGHDRKITLGAIADMAPKIEAMGIEFVLAKDLVKAAKKS